MSTWQPPASSSIYHPSSASSAPNSSFSSSPTPISASPIYRPIIPSVGVIPHFDTHLSGPTQSEQEKVLYEQEKQRERLAVVNQPHRTFPVVTPKPKPIHDYPIGSYLRHVRDPTWQQPPRVSSPVPRPDKLKEVMNRFAGDLDAEKVVHLQYNSPLNVYSKDSIAETLAPQTNAKFNAPTISNNQHPSTQSTQYQAHHYPSQQQQQQQQQQPQSHHHHHYLVDPMMSRLSVSPTPYNSNTVTSGGPPNHLRPSTPITDIRKSPTWQLIQEQESGKVYGPVKERVNSPVGATLHVSSIDGHESPAQSQTFKHLMTALVDHPSY